MLRILLGVLEPDGGDLQWNGHRISALDRQRWGYMPQERSLYQTLRATALVGRFTDSQRLRDELHQQLDYVLTPTLDVNSGANGFGWQAWGGVGVPLGNRMRMFGEAFFNDADLNRNVYDYNVDASYRETIHEEGVGIRGGLSYGF